jgi:hypothetical protein
MGATERYILGEEAGGAFVGGLRYGDGKLYTKNAGDLRVYWQGPSIAFDAGADGGRPYAPENFRRVYRPARYRVPAISRRQLGRPSCSATY